MIEFYDSLLASDDELVTDKVFKARLQVDYARKLMEIELFPKALALLEKAESDLGDFNHTEEDKSVAFWRIRYTLGKL